MMIGKEGNDMAEKGVPKRDGSGRGVRANKGRGGCKTPRKTGQGRSGTGGGGGGAFRRK